MGLVCRIAGHKWRKLPDGKDGCTCSRCGEIRDDGHLFQPITGKCEERCAVCGKVKTLSHQWNYCQCERCGEQRDECHDWEGCKCRKCGKVREEGHDWEGCKCRKCGKVREEGHDWKVFPRDRIVASEKTISREHMLKCSICGQSKWEDHVFENNACRYICAKCGYEEMQHEFLEGKCKNCGCSESAYYCELIASDKVGYYDNESKRGRIYITYGDHVKGIPDLTRLAIAKANNNGADNYAPKSIIRRIEEEAADRVEADKALADIASSDKVHIYWRSYACERIRNKRIRKQPGESIRLWIEAHPVSQAEIDYENTMIAMDSGLGRSG